MKSKYRLFYFSEKTPAAAAIAAAACSVIYIILGTVSGLTGLIDYFDLIVRVLVLAALLYSYMKHNLLLMQAACIGLLFCMMYVQAYYALETLYLKSAEEYIAMGFFGSIFVANELMILFVTLLIVVNHFIIFTVEKNSNIRIAVNQLCIIVLLVLHVFQLFVFIGLKIGLWQTICFTVFALSEIAALICVDSGELILALDRNERLGE